ncbi:uncharacterized protein TRIVIDRAFT_44253 [Trichoderma virens Gv29-8]|uniref:Uncharacterized protein n=1 Tax=Hypocrea virens (strain Gv29-8 / FGSC 10586) TaxID=413071 RepID=G9N363_HYPVG|nr:uncharacterized protein TRIVIDRAFT_44253 [Trichoderma virens Gv29-8]EHK18747.1 hypothetical protein TRIVIDRAFT_44253 [Trichoderma virens Gv29-8]UKZ56530.1 hypothetical protein TrVGV298_010367 [Trichoderma virens]
MSGFGDAEKLRAARELAQSFSRTKDPKKRNIGGSSLGPRKEHSEPYRQQPAKQTRYGQIPAPSWQGPTQGSTQGSTSSSSSIPPPSQRDYSSLSSFSTGGVRKSVIGSSGLDFLKASGAKSRDVEKPPTGPVPIVSEAANVDQQAESTGNGSAIDGASSSTSPQPTEGISRGNILDAFLSIVAKKPSIGQEIDTLTKMIPKAMDLNAPEPVAEATTPKGQSNGDKPKRSEAGTNQNSGLGHSQSEKPSPVAAAAVSSNGRDQGQTAGTNGAPISPSTKAKGLSASAWA